MSTCRHLRYCKSMFANERIHILSDYTVSCCAMYPYSSATRVFPHSQRNEVHWTIISCFRHHNDCCLLMYAIKSFLQSQIHVSGPSHTVPSYCPPSISLSIHPNPSLTTSLISPVITKPSRSSFPAQIPSECSSGFTLKSSTPLTVTI